MELGFWIVIIFTLLYEPIVGYFDFQRYKAKVKQKGNVRSKYYIKIIIDLWVPAIFILMLVVFSKLTLKDIGLALPIINTNALGPVITYLVFAISLCYLIGVLCYSIGYQFSESIRTKLSEVKEKERGRVGFSEILPITDKEKKIWNYVSLTAGITEEIIYRGFMLFVLAYLFPGLSIWLIILLSSLLFGLAHTYQGFTTGVLRATILGVIFSILYIGLGSILPLIFAHFLIDYLAKLGELKVPSQILEE